jgi:hypothetical protein
LWRASLFPMVPTFSLSWFCMTSACCLLLFVTCNYFTYIGEERTWTYSKHISRDRYPASLLARRSDLQIKHITLSLSTVVTSPWTLKTQLPLLCNLATDCLPRICLRGNLFTNPLPSNGSTFNNILRTVSNTGIYCSREKDGTVYLVLNIFENSTVNVSALGNSCEGMALVHLYSVQWNGSISETFRNRTHVHIHFLLTMTEAKTSKNIELFS